MPKAPQQKRPSHLKLIAWLLAGVLVVVFFLPFFAQPKTAQALPGEALAAQVWRYIKDRIDDAIKLARKYSADVAFKNALKVYMTRFAEDTAVWLASAGTGQKPLFVTDPHYWKNLTDAAAGDFLDTIATKNFGIDVCKPVDLKRQFSIESAVKALVDPANFCTNQCKSNQDQALTTDTFIVGEQEFTNGTFTTTVPNAEKNINRMKGDVAGGLNPGSGAWAHYPEICGTPVTVGDCIGIYDRDLATYKRVVNQDYRLCLNLCGANKKVARCTYSQIEDNVKNLKGQIKNKDFIPKFTKTFEPGENDIGQLLTLAEKAKDAVAEKTKIDETLRGASDILPLVDKITGEVKTPRSLVGGAAQKLTEDPSGDIFSIHTGSPVADAIGVFTNTLTKSLLKRIFQQGFNPKSNPAIAFDSGFAGTQAARLLFSSLAKVDYSTGGASTSLNELATCPDTTPGPNHCVIEEGFRQAIEQGLTIQEALSTSPPLLHGDWPVGYEYSSGRNVEPNYKQGYPYRSLLILRRLRILPVGWELAAQYMKDVDTAGGTANQRSLAALIDAFDNCGQDGNNPSDFCGLIDPNWVLKSPETLCRFSGASAVLTSDDYFPDPIYPDAPDKRQIGRLDVCADEQTCLEEDENGKCRAFGYCIQERQSWKFGGDKCTPAYHSCETFVDPNGSESAYLKKTLDYDDCSATSAGCKWYCSDYDFSTAEFVCTATIGDKERFTAKVKGCPENALGCTEYIRTTNTSNITANGGFETFSGSIDDGPPDSFSGWTPTGVSAEAVSDSHGGGVAAKISGSGGQEWQSAFDTKFPLNGQSTTLTFYGKASGCAGFFGMRTTAGGADYFVRTPVTFSNDWDRYTTTLTYDPSLTYDSTVITTFFEFSGCDATIDDVQTEFGATFSSYKEYGSINKVYLNGERQSCRPEEVGCDFYSSATEKIPGIATSADFCPADQVGCRAFQEVAVTENGANPDHPVRTGKRCSQDQSRSCFNDSDCPGAGSCLPSVSFIPKTGKTCSAAYVGCEEYTNLDEVARGGEGKEYYTYIRECVKPTGNPDNEKTFYTWIGSEETGFQLVAYLLKPTDDIYPGAGDVVGGGPEYNANADPNDPNLCNESIHEGGENPDCRKFYDAAINIYYRLYSKTISVSDDCHPLRNTIDGVTYNAIPAEGTSCPAAAAQCREYRGASGFNTRTILKDTFDDGDTVGWSNPTWSTESLIFGGGSAFSGGTMETNTDAALTEKLTTGRSYIVTFWAGSGNGGSDNATLTARFSHSPPSEFFDGEATIRWDPENGGHPLWNFYTLGPLHFDHAVDPDDQLQFAIAGGSAFYIDNIKLYEVADNLYMIKESQTLCTGNENCDLYRNRANQTFTLKSFTRLCSEDKVGCEALINTQNSDSPFQQTFTSPYDPAENRTVHDDVVDLVVNDSKKYCRSEEQGCTRLGSPTLGNSGYFCSNAPTQACVEDDECQDPPGGTCDFQQASIKQYDTVFLANDPDQYDTTLCWKKQVGCEEWKSKITGETKYFHRPEPYTCEYKAVTINSESFTDWYRTGESGLEANDICPTVSPAPPEQDEIFPVSPYTQPTGFCMNNPSQTCSNDSDCGANQECLKWAGLCPFEQSGCKEYRDTSDPSSCRSDCLLIKDREGKNVPVDEQCLIDPFSAKNGCRGYWYLKQSVEANAADCNGAIDEEIGCRQFYSPDP